MPLLRQSRAFRFSRLTLFAVLLISGLAACASPEQAAPQTAEETVVEEPTSQEPAIVFLGDSITAGYGIDPEEAFPALIEQRIDSLGLPFRVVNAGLSGETSAGGLRRVDWLLDQPIHTLVIELGGNDGLRGISTVDTKSNLQGIIDQSRAKHPSARIVVAGMQIPTNLGEDYRESFRTLFPELAAENDAVLIPFILDGVAGIPDLNQRDQIHPTEAGHAIIAETVWKTLYPLIDGPAV